MMGSKETPQRQEFGSTLKALLKKNGIKIGELANAMNVSGGYISQVINGSTILTEDRFIDLTSYLEDNIRSQDDIIRLSGLYFNAKAGTSFFNTGEIVQATTVQRHFLQLFIQLTSDQQMDMLNSMLQNIEDNKNRMELEARRAGFIAEKRGEYKTDNKKQ